ncbi:MAG: ABC transporter ATP-binding protein [Acidobacteria bacterium]|nr:ABC transporter ATP-binding protein [Acidobacteriota bacterium]
MIQVEHLTKRYGNTLAINDVTFDVKKGEILGFLGPNGAGKTTTMRILSGFIPATDGKARVSGYDVFEQPLEVKRRIGYLPENPPLYQELSVDSFLTFVAQIRGVKSEQISDRLEAVKEQCGLEDMGSRLIKYLSKGYRQRVALAQALIHDPDVLILDEPTVGLDPKQIIEVRELIKRLAGEHTIILSSHILPEVSMTCQRVVIINNGRVVATDTPENLKTTLAGSNQVQIEFRGDMDGVRRALASLGHLKSVRPESTSANAAVLRVEVEPGFDERADMARAVVQSGADLLELKTTGPSLEDIFLKLTTEESGIEA